MATILTKKKDTTGAPATGDLTNSSGGAELAVNTADKRLYTKNSSNAVVEIGTNPGTAVTFTAGTASDPAITTTGDTNTGIFFPAADTIAFAEGGAEAMRINSSGNVGIGTTSPTCRLNVVGSAVLLSDFDSSNANGGYMVWRTSGTVIADLGTAENCFGTGGSDTFAINARSARSLLFGTSNAERMRITSAGEVLVGGTTSIVSGSGCLTLQTTNSDSNMSFFRNDSTIVSNDSFGVINWYGNDTTSNTPTAHAYISAVASGTHAAGDNPTDLVFGCTNDDTGTVAEFARLLQSGASGRTFRTGQPTLVDGQAVSVSSRGGTAGSFNRLFEGGVYKHAGITNSCAFIGLQAEDGVNNFLWADNSDILRISTTGNHIGTTSGTVVGAQTSDERLKDISGPVTYGLNEVLAIEPIAFTMKDDPSIAKIGFSAQQVQPIVPEAVYDTKECIDGYTENEETKEQIPNSDRTKLAMEYTQLIPVLVNAVKELSAELDAAKARIATLEGN